MQSHSTSSETLKVDSVKDLLETIAKLRAPDGCPWDKEQTHESLKKYLIEEVYEVLEAIDNNSEAEMLEEFGDLLFQICLHAQIEAEKGNFTFNDIADKLNKKMISRHPHVFGGVELKTENQVVEQWEEIKAEEKKAKQQENNSPYASIPAALPSLARALKVLKKTSKLSLSVDKSNFASLAGTFDNQEELGKILLTIVNKAKELKLDPEEALRQSVAKIQKEAENNFKN
ncbi:MAG TPA: MazG family protein [Vampirovibrionales bacterium]